MMGDKLHKAKLAFLKKKLELKQKDLHRKQEIDEIGGQIDEINQKLHTDAKGNPKEGKKGFDFGGMADKLADFGEGAAKVADNLNHNLLGAESKDSKKDTEKDKRDYVW